MSSAKGPELPAKTFPRRSPRILWREVEGSVILFHEETGRAFALNEAAARVWKLCDGTRSLEDLSSALGGSGKVAPMIERLAETDCVELVTGGESGGPTDVAAEDSGPQPAGRGSQPCGPAPGTWSAPVVEEIVFAACDCSGAARGVMKISLCTSTSPKKAQS